MTIPPLRLSASAVRDFRTCKFRHALGYVRPVPWHLRRRITIFLVGSVIHEVMAAFIQSGGWGRISKQTLLDMLAMRWANTDFGDEMLAPRLLDHARRLVATAYDMRYPAGVVRELATERKVTWRRPRRGILAVGRLDRVVQLADGTIECIDLKTGRAPRDEAALARDAQSLLMRSLVGEVYQHLAPPAIRVTYQFLATASVVTLEFTREDFMQGWRAIEEVAADIRAAREALASGEQLHEAFAPSPGPECNTCPFYDTCRALLEDGLVATDDVETMMEETA